MPDKQGVLNHFKMCEKQAEFDGDGNSAAMFLGLFNDVLAIASERAFFVRPTFVDGSEKAARDATRIPVSSEPIPASDDPAHDAPAMPVQEPDEQPTAETPISPTQPVEPASAEPAAGPVEPVLPSQPIADGGGYAPGSGDASAGSSLTDAEHEQTQDERIAKLETELANAKADKATPDVAKTFAPVAGSAG